MRSFLLSFLLLSLCGCSSGTPQVTGVDLASLTAAPDKPWPEGFQAVVITPTPDGFAVSVGNNSLTVTSSDKRQAERMWPMSDKQAWSGQINSWRIKRFLTQTYPLSLQKSNILQKDRPIVIWVSPNCSLCDRWKSSWPTDIPAVWVPVGPPPGTPLKLDFWLKKWCTPGLLGLAPIPSATSSVEYLSSCENILNQQRNQAQRLGVRIFPSMMSPDGDVLSGWPDAAWLKNWLKPNTSSLVVAEHVKGAKE